MSCVVVKRVEVQSGCRDVVARLDVAAQRPDIVDVVEVDVGMVGFRDVKTPEGGVGWCGGDIPEVILVPGNAKRAGRHPPL